MCIRDRDKSGGIATNIGVHFFDMLSWVFGQVKENTIHIHTHDRAAGLLEFDRARIRWFLSINYDTIPEDVKATGKRTFRSMEVDGEQIEFSDGFTELHTTSYKAVSYTHLDVYKRQDKYITNYISLDKSTNLST